MPGDYRGNLANAGVYPGQVAITNAVSALAGAAIQITAAGHGMVTGDEVDITGVAGCYEANVQTQITRVDANNYTIGVAFVHAYTSGGTSTPIAFLNSYTAFSDGDVDNAANRAAAATYPSADRETLLLATTGGFKLVQYYADPWYDNNAPAGTGVATAWCNYTEAGSTLNTWAELAALGTFAVGATAAIWPRAGSGVVFSVQQNDLIEVTLDTTLLYESNTGLGICGASLMWSQYNPGPPAARARLKGSEKSVAQTSGANREIPLSLRGLVQAGSAGSQVTVSLAVNQTVAASTIALTGDYMFTAKIWRPTGVPQ